MLAQIIRHGLAATAIVLGALIFGAPPSYAQQVSPILAQKSPDAANMVALAQSQGRVRIVVQYQTPVGPGHASRGTPQENLPALMSENQAAQDSILSDHFGSTGLSTTPDNALRRMTVTPAFAINATAAEIEALANDPRVLTVDLDKIGRPQLIESVPLIGMTAAYATYNATGNGYAVAVMDTGVEKTHKFLANVVAEACFSTTFGTLGAGGTASICPGGASSSTAAGSGVNCNIAWDGCEHGTHVAGIAAGFNTEPVSGQPPNGVAKTGKIIAIKMYSESTGTDCTNFGLSSPCVVFWYSDFQAAMDYVYANRNSFPGVQVAAVNLSGGGGHYSGNCDTASGSPALKTSIDNLRSVNIATVMSAGNGSSTSQIGQPACISSGIAVASSTKSDGISSFTDISTQVAVFAPGNSILSSLPAGAACGSYSGPVPSSGGSYCFFNGTSMAAPHVAGAFAAIRNACPTKTVDQILAALESTGTPITDNRGGGTITKPRIRVDLALQQLACVSHAHDFDGDAKSDILWRYGPTGGVVMWLMNGTAVTTSAGIGGDTNWTIVGTGDFNGDGKSDILWRNTGNGIVVMWQMNGTAVTTATTLGGDLNWTVAGTGDFNGDGKTDILWRNASNGIIVMWQMNGTAVTTATTLGGDLNWTVAGTGDFNGDGKSDILWRNASNGVDVMWLMNGAAVTTAAAIGGDLNWTVAGTGDFNGDGKSDILWRNVSNGVDVMWLMNGTTATTAAAIGGDLNWTVAGTGDFNGDSKSDILWRNVSSGGGVVMWLMNGTTATTAAFIGGDANWIPTIP